MMTTMFNDDTLFIDYCVSSDNGLDCSNRDKLYVDIYTVTSIVFNVACFVNGVISDYFGLVTGMTISFILSISGLIMLAFVDKTENIICYGLILLLVLVLVNHNYNLLA